MEKKAVSVFQFASLKKMAVCNYCTHDQFVLLPIDTDNGQAHNGNSAIKTIFSTQIRFIFQTVSVLCLARALLII